MDALILATLQSWVEENIEFFDPRNRLDSHQLPHLKAFDELALLALLETRHGVAKLLTPKIRNFANSVLEEQPVPRVFVDSIAHFQLVAIPAALQAKNATHDSLRQLIRLCLPATATLSTERLPHRTLDVIYCAQKANLDFELFGDNVQRMFNSALQTSNLVLGTPPHAAGLADFYALTHTIFFISDFGAEPIPAAINSRSKELARASIELALLRFGAEDNLDIVAELLWCLRILGGVSGTAAQYSIGKVVAAIGQKGYLPGPSLDSPPKVAALYDEVYPNYHSTLLGVALFAGGLLQTSQSTSGNYRGIRIRHLHAIGKALFECAEMHPLSRLQKQEGIWQQLQDIPDLCTEAHRTVLLKPLAWADIRMSAA